MTRGTKAAQALQGHGTRHRHRGDTAILPPGFMSRVTHESGVGAVVTVRTTIESTMTAIIALCIRHTEIGGGHSQPLGDQGVPTLRAARDLHSVRSMISTQQIRWRAQCLAWQTSASHAFWSREDIYGKCRITTPDHPSADGSR